MFTWYVITNTVFLLLLIISDNTIFGFQSPMTTTTTSTNNNNNKMIASVNIALTVDGYIATKDGGVDWLNEQPTEEGIDYGEFFTFLQSVDVIIMGRKSFDKVISFGKDAYIYGERKVIVWTRNISNVNIPEYVKEYVECSTLEPKLLIQQVQSNGYQHAYIDGGVTIQNFLKTKLITRMTLTRIPILLGDGIPLFSNDSNNNGQVKLTHIASTAYDNGFVTSTYDINYSNNNDDKEEEQEQQKDGTTSESK